MDVKELSIIVMSEASLATEVPSPMERPTWAAFRGGPSVVAVRRDRHHLVAILQCLHKALLVHGASAGYYL